MRYLKVAEIPPRIGQCPDNYKAFVESFETSRLQTVIIEPDAGDDNPKTMLKYLRRAVKILKLDHIEIVSRNGNLYMRKAKK